MKKTLLIIVIVFLVFQMIVLAIVIDIGPGAINRPSGWGGDRTFVDNANPANASGTITSVEIWATVDLIDCEVATFYVVSGNDLSTRDFHTIGTVTSGSKQTFSGLNITVNAGDYLGIRFSSGTVDYNSSGGAGVWYINGDYIPCTNQTFSYAAGYVISIYGTGTAEEEEENAIFFGCNF